MSVRDPEPLGGLDGPAADPVGSRLVSRRLAVAAVVLWMGTGCRSKPAPSPPVTGPLIFDDDPESAPSGAKDPGAPAAGAASDNDAADGCKAGGTPWGGKHEGCLYEVAGCCYGDAQSACQAAGCEGKGCQVLESAPAQIVCHPS